MTTSTEGRGGQCHHATLGSMANGVCMLHWTAPLVALASVVNVASAATGAAEAQSRSLAATCASCHASSGTDAAARPLAGMPVAEMIRVMGEFRAGTRNGTVMPQLAKGYTDAQITAIASWYAAQKQ